MQRAFSKDPRQYYQKYHCYNYKDNATRARPPGFCIRKLLLPHKPSTFTTRSKTIEGCSTVAAFYETFGLFFDIFKPVGVSEWKFFLALWTFCG